MKIETMIIGGKLNHEAFADDLPGCGRVPVNLNRLDDDGWAAQSAHWPKASADDLAALRVAAQNVVGGKAVNATPTKITPVLSYMEKRRRAYASYGDQFDMMYRDLVNGTTEWKDHIAAVKAAFPKD